MSEFITLYQRRQGIKARMRKIKYYKNTQQEYQELKDASDVLSKRLDEIIAHEKNIIQLNKV